MLWEIDLHPRRQDDDRSADAVRADARDLRIAEQLDVASAHGYLLEGEALGESQVADVARELLVDVVVEEFVAAPTGDARLLATPPRWQREHADVRVVYVIPKPGVMDPVAQSAASAIRAGGQAVDAVRTLRKYWIAGLDDEALKALATRVLANDAIEEAYFDALLLETLDQGDRYRLKVITVPIRSLDDAGLMKLSREGQLYLQLPEMQTIQRQFDGLHRDPTDIELETIAQTWSEHCSHKTLAGRIAYRDEKGERHFENMLRETIFAATEQLRKRRGDDDWCVSVFRDNAGVIRFDGKYDLTFKVETHNHPSALEPYGGANTGVGGVIRDTIGTGLGAKPIAGTDVFCFAPPDTPPESLPPGVLHPKLVMRGVVEGVRDYGNRMGIPTVNGAICFDPRYLGNPLVYCGSVGLLPRDKTSKEPRPGDLIVSVGGRTGRDGIHGATFSSAELTSESESLSGGAVQIGNAIEEKKVLDVILAARDRGLFTALTDCGAGGFSSAVGEMGEELGAEVWLERAPLKYSGLSYTEIWISEAQERMVLSVPESNWPQLADLCRSEDVEATILGRFEATGRLMLKYAGEVVGDLTMDFLHNGRPPVVREAIYQPPPRHRVADSRPRRLHARSACHSRIAQRRQQRMGHPAVRPRSAGRQYRQAAGRSRVRWSERRGRRTTGAWLAPRRGDRLRNQSPLRRFRPVRYGGQRHRRSDPKLRCRWRRPGPNRDPR
ncbi:AIR synthase-related protein [Pirellulales bacterium]|nr:AIR synthase-related protein [Pirellulales bacterium]